MRVDLRVPFEEKYQAQELGARWDPARKVWFVPDGTDASKFLRWLPGAQISKKVAAVLQRQV